MRAVRAASVLSLAALGVVGVVGVVGVGGCASREPAPARAEPARPAIVVSEDPIAQVPSLEDERAVQAWREATALSRRLGLPIDAVTSGDAPAWWNPALRHATFGRAHGRNLEPTLAMAGRQAEGISGERDAELARAGRVIRGAYARLSSGEYVAWAAFARPGDAIALEPVVEPVLGVRPIAALPNAPAVNPASSAMPTLAQPRLPMTPAQPATGTNEGYAPLVAGPEAPAWWSEEPVEAGGRLTVCVMAVGADTREAARHGVREARVRLTRILGAEPRGLITHKQETRELADGRVAAFVMVSAPRTMNP